MKTRITIVLAAVAFAAFAVPNAYAWWHSGPELQLNGYGGIYVTSSEDGVPTPLDGQPFTSLATGITKGSGSPLFVAQAIVAEPFVPDLASCPQELPLRGDLSGSNQLTFRDGSLLSLGFTGSICCTDGTVFECDLSSTVIGGERRFEGATGVYEGTATAEDGRLTYELSVDLD